MVGVVMQDAGIVNSFPGREQLFSASCVAILATAMTFGVRADIMNTLANEFSLSHEQVGWIAGTAFWGFTVAMLGGGQACDRLGMKLLVYLAFACHAVGLLLTIAANSFAMLFAGTLAVGLGNGLVESALNPLVPTLYPRNKSERLNRLHVWFPAGIALGGLISFAATGLGLGWRPKMATIAVPTLFYAVLFLRLPFPNTECARATIPARVRYKQALRPGFLFLLFCILLTAASELGPSQWIPSILTDTAGMPGIFVLVWIALLEATGRRFAGPVLHRISPVLLLLLATILTAVGLYGLGSTSAKWPIAAFATSYALGICFCWPTMYGITAEQFPLGGAFLLALIGSVGMLSDAFAVPLIGDWYDRFGAAMAIRRFAILPGIAAVCFGGLWLYHRANGGYRVLQIEQGREAPAPKVLS